jgi:hypothetical protein
VPIDSSWISIRKGEKLAEIILDAKPVAAIVVAGDKERLKSSDYFSCCCASIYQLKIFLNES